ncbi:MAG: NAD(P)-dependent oxidoreductase [Thermoflexales bacterium]|nr:NAD(P)-dependent oxidoreductase [Thermoflexales bacterium]MDW8352777.1 NAD(P)-dependent oxidoreductase [Anaerolineae bacterium]
MTRVVISGASGFLGSHLARRLAAAGYDVVALVRANSNLRRLADLTGRIHIACLDQETLNGLLRKLTPIAAVIHAAVNYGRADTKLSELVETNVLFGLRLAEAAQSVGATCFINVGSALPPKVSPYALSKHQLSAWLQRLDQAVGMRIADVALENMYGEDENENQFVPRVILACLRNVERLPLTAGDQQRDFIYIEDVVEAFALLLRYCLQAEARMNGYARYPLGSGNAVRIRDVASMIQQITGASTQLDFGAVPYRPHEAMFSQADLSAWKRLGWLPRHTLESGLRRAVAWWQNHLQETKRCAG